MLGISEDCLRETPAYKFHQQESPEDESLLFKSRVLAFAPGTWQTHVSAFRDFKDFCDRRNVSCLTGGPSLVNLFLLHSAQAGKSIGYIERFTSALAFYSRFFLISYGIDPTVSQVLKFLEKVCPKNTNVKEGFGALEVRKLWDSIDNTYGGVLKLTKIELRTFVMAIFQHKTFCRFSDIAGITLDDVIYNMDYFKVKISCSKTDQAGRGQEVFVVKSASLLRDPHQLMCVYLSAMGFEDFPPEEQVFLFPPLK